MGTEISLEIAGMQLDWSKNSKGADHGALFQESDRMRIPFDQINYEYFEENGEDPAPMEMGFSRKLREVVPRLRLLGFTREHAKREYLRAVQVFREEEQDVSTDEDSSPKALMDFDEYCKIVASYTITTLDNQYVSERNDEEQKGRFAGLSWVNRLPHSLWHDPGGFSERSTFASLIGFLSPYSILALLAENHQNLDADVVWQYGPLVENGWAKTSDFVACAKRTQTFLVATEGSSDVHILKHAIAILHPELADFFRFIDVEEGHPFSGAGSLVKFAVGLAKIDVHNQVVFLFDNDGEGFEAYKKVSAITLPPNMRTIMLPALDEFESFSCRGPHGISDANINRRAAAIECYLDLTADKPSPPRVTWTNYKKELDLYHGSLDHKESYVKAFLQQTAKDIHSNSYDASKIRAVINALIRECSSISEASLATMWELVE